MDVGTLIRLAFCALALLCASADSVFAQAEPTWITDRDSGCRVWDPIPFPDDKVSWRGPCRDGYAEGHGQLKWYNHDTEMGTYDGQVLRGKMTGSGTITFANGMSYVGELQDNLANGKGVITFEGRTFTGIWTKGCLNADGHTFFVGWGAADTCKAASQGSMPH